MPTAHRGRMQEGWKSLALDQCRQPKSAVSYGSHPSFPPHRHLEVLRCQRPKGDTPCPRCSDRGMPSAHRGDKCTFLRSRLCLAHRRRHRATRAHGSGYVEVDRSLSRQIFGPRSRSLCPHSDVGSRTGLSSQVCEGAWLAARSLSGSIAGFARRSRFYDCCARAGISSWRANRSICQAAPARRLKSGTHAVEEIGDTGTTGIQGRTAG